LDRIKYYGSSDMSCGWGLQNIFEYMNKPEPLSGKTHINDLIELFNIVEYIESGLRLKDWSDEYYDNLYNLKPEIMKLVSNGINAINDENFICVLEQVDNEYVDDFIQLFAKFELYNVISWLNLEQALLLQFVQLWMILEQVKIVDKYGVLLRNYIVRDPENLEIVLQSIVNEKNQGNKSYYLPKEFTNLDFTSMIQQYLGTLHPNLNYLKMIATFMNQGGRFSVTRKQKYDTKRRIKELETEMFSTQGHGIETRVEVSIRPQDESKKVIITGQTSTFTFDSQWISGNLDYPTILNNFIYLFEYTDLSFRINLLSNPNEVSKIEETLMRGSKTDYFESSAFIVKNMLADIELMAYDKYLNDQNIQLHNVLLWYYKVYLKDEFKIENFEITIPLNNLNYFEKCKSLAPEFESILRQYQLLVEQGRIDHEYLVEVNPDIRYDLVPSNIEDKYAYSNNEKMDLFMFHLFSDQSPVHYIPSLKLNEKSLFAQLTKRTIRYDNFDKRQKEIIDLLVKEQLLSIDPTSDQVRILFGAKITILRNLYEYGFINVGSYNYNTLQQILTWKKEEMLITKKSLLSKQEASYYNYFLNNSEFGNAKSLRNKYSHGSAFVNEEMNKSDYYVLLKLLVLLIIKIDNDLQLRTGKVDGLNEC